MQTFLCPIPGVERMGIMSRKRTIKADDIIRDRLSGMSDAELTNKYQISRAVLDEICQQLLIHGTIRVRDIVSDVRAGASDFELMSKYEVSSVVLETLLGDLVKKGHLRHAELIERSPYYDDPANRVQTRKKLRTRVRIRMAVYDSRDRSILGVLRDISDTGLRLATYSQEVAKCEAFLIRAEPFDQVKPFRFKAVCRWISPREHEKPYYLAGFEITEISDEARSELRKLVDLLPAASA
jgi:uncharacterized protein (DUF433 family)